MGAPGAVNMHYFAWKLLSAMNKFSFIHSSFMGSVVRLAKDRTVLGDLVAPLNADSRKGRKQLW